MKRKLWLFVLVMFSGFLFAEEKISEKAFVPVSSTESNYALIFSNYLTEGNISLEAYVYDEVDSLIFKQEICSLEAKQNSIVFLNAANILSEANGNSNAYIIYKIINNGESISFEKKIPVNQLVDNFTEIDFSTKWNSCKHTIVEDADKAKSTNKKYDRSKKYLSFNMNDDLSWMKGEWVRRPCKSQNVPKYIIIEEAKPFSIVKVKIDDNSEWTSRLFVQWFTGYWMHDGNKFFTNEDNSEFEIEFPMEMLVAVYERPKN